MGTLLIGVIKGREEEMCGEELRRKQFVFQRECEDCQEILQGENYSDVKIKWQESLTAFYTVALEYHLVSELKKTQIFHKFFNKVFFSKQI